MCDLMSSSASLEMDTYIYQIRRDSIPVSRDDHRVGVDINIMVNDIFVCFVCVIIYGRLSAGQYR